MFQTILWVLLSLVLFSCNGSDLSTGPTRQGGGGLDQLSKASQEKFDRWTGQVLKACNASSIFTGTNPADETGVDYKALYHAAGNSYLLKKSDQEFVVLGNYSGFSGTAESTFEQSVTIDEQTENIEARTIRKGSLCEVYVFGKKVYEAQIGRSASIAGHSTKGKKPAPIRVALRTPRTKIGGIQAVENHRIHEALWQSLAPSDEAYQLVADRLKISLSEAERYFKPSTTATSRPTVSFRFSDEISPLLFGDNDTTIVGIQRELEKVFAMENQPQDLKVYLKEIHFPESAEGDKPAITWQLNSQFNTYTKNGDTYLEVGDFEIDSKTPLRESEASKCLIDRAMALEAALDNSRGLYSNLDQLKRTCSVLSTDIHGTIYSQATASKIFPAVLSHANPSHAYNYNGWGSAFLNLAAALGKRSLNIREILDPRGEAPVIAAASENLSRMGQKLKAYPRLDVIQTKLLGMAGSWALYGSRFSASDSEVILSALDNSVDPFLVSTVGVLEKLAKSPAERPDDLLYAASVSESLKSEARRALRMARALDYQQWIDDSFARSLQKEYSQSYFAKWADRLESINEGLKSYPKLRKRSSELTEISLALMDQGYEPSQMKFVYRAIDNISEDFPKATDALIDKLKRDPGSAKEDLEFAHQLTPEYKSHLAKVASLAREVGLATWVEGVEGRLFKDRYPLALVKSWQTSLTSAQAFTQRDRKRLRDEQADSFYERRRLAVLTHALEELWLDSEFTQLEQIAALGTHSPFCQRYQSYSSIADCLGLQHFSTKNESLVASSYKGRYGALAEIITKHLQAPSSSDSSFLNDSLVRDYFSSGQRYIWKSCNNPQFEAKAQSLKQDLKTLRSTTDSMDQWDLERKIKESLNDCRRQL